MNRVIGRLRQRPINVAVGRKFLLVKKNEIPTKTYSYKRVPKTAPFQHLKISVIWECVSRAATTPLFEGGKSRNVSR
jgi:hypothetical protein